MSNQGLLPIPALVPIFWEPGLNASEGCTGVRSQRLAQSSFLSRGRHCYSMDSLLMLENWTSDHSRAQPDTQLCWHSALQSGNCLPLNSTLSHPIPTVLSSQHQNLKWFLPSFSQPADPYLASLGTLCNLLTGNSQSGSLTSLPSFQEQRWHQ